MAGTAEPSQAINIVRQGHRKQITVNCDVAKNTRLASRVGAGEYSRTQKSYAACTRDFNFSSFFIIKSTVLPIHVIIQFLRYFLGVCGKEKFRLRNNSGGKIIFHSGNREIQSFLLFNYVIKITF